MSAWMRSFSGFGGWENRAGYSAFSWGPQSSGGVPAGGGEDGEGSDMRGDDRCGKGRIVIAKTRRWQPRVPRSYGVVRASLHGLGARRTTGRRRTGAGRVSAAMQGCCLQARAAQGRTRQNRPMQAPRLLMRLPSHVVNGISAATGIALIQGVVALAVGPLAALSAGTGSICASLADLPIAPQRTWRRVGMAAIVAWASQLVIAALRHTGVTMGL